MNVLSLFDGMSCGMLALDRLGIKVNKYYASEIDKYAMQVSAANYPEIIQVGDVCDLKSEDFKDIDLILAGSPCQGFSFAGKQLAFDDLRSALFFEFIRLLKEIKPKYFLLENVKMKKEYLQIISEQVSACYPEIPFGIEPIFINSSLVSAQSRQRYYWTNIPNITQPEERGIVLRDILEEGFDTERDKSHCLDANYYKGSSVENYFKKSRRQMVFNKNLDKMTTKDGKAYCVTANYDAARPKNSMDRKQRTMIPLEDGQELPSGTEYIYDETNKSHKPQHIGTAVDVRAMTEVRTPEANQIRYEHKRRTGKDWSPRHMRHLVERQDEKMNTLTSALTKQHILQITEEQEVYWRKLTPLECERLQTVPDNYTNHVSNTQRYKMLGNGWTIEVIAHILKNMEIEQ
jgi:DNA-cytosine methyltransferase